MAEDVEAIIRRVAREEGIDPDLLVAVATQESGLRGDSIGDQGHSVGAFQENDRGRGYGLSVAQRSDVEASTRRAATEFKQFMAKDPTLDPGKLAAAAQRPNDRAGYATKVNAIFNALKAGSQGAPGPVRAAVGAVASAGQQAADLFWPVVGQKPGAITNPFGGPQAYSAGMSRDIGHTNNGVDLKGNYGDPIVSRSDGVVVSVESGYGDRANRVATDNYGWGNSVVIRHDDGREVRYSHQAADSITVKPGMRVSGGTLLGAVGDSGNATGPHLDFETKINGQFVDGTKGAYQAADAPTMPGAATPGRTNMAEPATATAAPRAKSPKQVQAEADAAEAKASVAAEQAAVDDARAQLEAINTAPTDDLGNVTVPPADVPNGMGPPGQPKVLSESGAAAERRRLEAIISSRTSVQQRAQAKQDKAEGVVAAEESTAAKPPETPPAPTTKAGPSGSTWQWNPTSKKWEDSGIPADPSAAPKPSTFQGPDGKQYTLSADGTSATPVGGVGAADKPIRTITDPQSGAVFLQNPDGTKGQKLFDGAPHTASATSNGRIIGYDPTTMTPTGTIDTMTPEERAASTAKSAQEAETSRIALDLTKQAMAQLDAAMKLPQGPQRTEALTNAMQQYAGMKDPGAVLSFFTQQAQQRLTQAKQMSDQSGYQVDPVTMQPVTGPDGQPLQTAANQEQSYRRELDYGKAVSEHERGVQANRTAQQTASSAATESYGRYGLATAPFQGNLIAAQAPVMGFDAAAKHLGVDQSNPIFKGMLSAMQASGALDEQGMPKMPQAPAKPTTPAMTPPPGGPQGMQGLVPPGGAQPAAAAPPPAPGTGNQATPGAGSMAAPPPAPDQGQGQPKSPLRHQDNGDGTVTEWYSDGTSETWAIPDPAAEGGGGGAMPMMGGASGPAALVGGMPGQGGMYMGGNAQGGASMAAQGQGGMPGMGMMGAPNPAPFGGAGATSPTPLQKLLQQAGVLGANGSPLARAA